MNLKLTGEWIGKVCYLPLDQVIAMLMTFDQMIQMGQVPDFIKLGLAITDSIEQSRKAPPEDDASLTKPPTEVGRS